MAVFAALHHSADVTKTQGEEGRDGGTGEEEEEEEEEVHEPHDARGHVTPVPRDSKPAPFWGRAPGAGG